MEAGDCVRAQLLDSEWSGVGAFFLAMLADAVSGDCVMANEAELTHDRAEFGGDHQKAEGAESEGGVVHVDSFVS